MKAYCLLPLFALIVTTSCKREPETAIAGTYVREYTRTQKHAIDIGRIVGKYTVRDTLFITKKKEGYQIKNHKWRKNEYDQEGWRNQRLSNLRPLPTYQVTYDPTDHSLNPVMSGMFPMFYLDTEKEKLYKGENREDYWQKID